MKMKTITLIRALTITVAVLSCPAAHAFADEANAGAKAEAMKHFQRGVELFQQNRLADAAVEFRTAYSTYESYKFLYNIGQVDAILGDAVGAVDAYEKYLTEAGDSIPAARKQAVQEELKKQRARIGEVTLQCEPNGADVRVDGSVMGTTPLTAPMRLTEGKHDLTLIAKGYDTQTRVLHVVGQVESTVKISLEPANPPPPLPPIVEPPKLAPTLAALPGTNPIRASPKPDSVGRTGNTQRIAGYAIGALGIVLGATGTVLTLVSWHEASTAQNHENAAAAGHNSTAWDDAHNDIMSARSLNKWGWSGIGVGAAALVGGVTLVLTAPKSSTEVTLDLSPCRSANVSGACARFEW